MKERKKGHWYLTKIEILLFKKLTNLPRTMGNTKSLNRDDIEKAAANTNWNDNSEVLTILKMKKKSKKNRRTSTTKESWKNDRQMDESDIDEIYNLVLALKQEGGEGMDLLNMFVARQANLPMSEFSLGEKPPITTIVVPLERPKSASQGKTRARAA